jgi:RsiW-degrading membrane proteinase PrsW (M82 family)
MAAVPDSLALAAGVLPLLVVVILLLLLDGFGLVTGRRLALAAVAGAGSAVAAALVSGLVLGLTDLPVATVARFVSPPLEEALKLVFPLVLIRTRRVGFAVDAAIVGFTVGAGFAVVETGLLVLVFDDQPGALWLLRGFGTGIMHGACTAVFAMVALTARIRTDRGFGLVAFGAWLLASTVHSLYNHFFVSPLVASLLLTLGLPILTLLVYRQSERTLQAWLGAGFAADAEILRLTRRGKLGSSPVGRYLQALRRHFAVTTVADMYCLLALRAELALRAKGRLMMREAGFSPANGDEWRQKLAEVRHLEREIGPTGRLALRPLLGSTHRDLWQLEYVKDV